MNWGVSAAVHAALETALPAEAEAGTFPRSAIEEAPPAPGPADVVLPRRRPPVPPVPPPAAAGDGAGPPATTPAPRATRPAPDLALLGQVLRGLQRLG